MIPAVAKHLQNLDQIDREILKLKMLHPKMALSDIGKLLSAPMSKQAVHSRMQKKSFQAYWDLLEKDIISQIIDAQAEAVVVILAALKSDNEAIRVKVALRMMDPIFEKCMSIIPDNSQIEELEWDIQPATRAEA